LKITFCGCGGTADAQGLGPCARKGVEVQLLSSAPENLKKEEIVKQALQALLISPDRGMRIAILEGRKTITIREGHRDYKPGHVVLCCQIEPWAVMADITDVKHCTLAEVTEEEMRADSFEDRADMIEGMRVYYPSLNWDSPITVIRWQNVQGFLVDNKDKYKKGKI
jgi:hypothetical protein